MTRALELAKEKAVKEKLKLKPNTQTAKNVNRKIKNAGGNMVKKSTGQKRKVLKTKAPENESMFSRELVIRLDHVKIPDYLSSQAVEKAKTEQIPVASNNSSTKKKKSVRFNDSNQVFPIPSRFNLLVKYIWKSKDLFQPNSTL